MRSFDLSPLFRSTVGFDRLSRLMDAAARVDESALAYPPYNIERTGEDTYRITMAVAGFGEDDLNVVTQDNQLLISGKNAKDEAENSFLYRGIAGRAFERRFTLADHIRQRCVAGERPAPCGAGARGAGSDEAASGEDRQRVGEVAADHRKQGRLSAVRVAIDHRQR
jgi:molecular chaperone IbpA